MQYNLIKSANACRWLYFSSLCSGCSSGILLLALPWTLLEQTKRALDISFLNITACILIVTILPIFSYFLDKFSTKKVYLLLLILNLLAAVIFSWWAIEFSICKPLFFVAFCYAALTRGLEQVARTILAQQFTDNKKYHELNRDLELVRQIITILSGLVFAVLSQWSLYELFLFCFAINLFSLSVLLCIPAPDKTTLCCHQQISSGFRTTSLTQVLYFFILILPYVAIMTQNTIYPSQVQDLLNLPKLYYSLMAIPYGMGAFLATYLAKYLVLVSSNLLFRLIFLMYIVAILIMLSIPCWQIFYLALLLFSWLQGSLRIERQTLLMKIYPLSFSARVIGYYESAATLCIVGLTIICGLLIDTFSVKAAWLAILFMLVIAMVVLCKLRLPQKSMLGQPNNSSTEN